MKTYLRFECGCEDRMGLDQGPFEYVQTVYGVLTVCNGDDEPLEIAGFVDNWWVTDDGQKWSDLVIWGA